MKSTTEKQILEWKEELARQTKTRDHAKKVFDECTTNDLKRQGDDAGEVYQWSIPVNGEQQQLNGVEYTIETPDDLVKQLERRS